MRRGRSGEREGSLSGKVVKNIKFISYFAHTFILKPFVKNMESVLQVVGVQESLLRACIRRPSSASQPAIRDSCVFYQSLSEVKSVMILRDFSASSTIIS